MVREIFKVLYIKSTVGILIRLTYQFRVQIRLNKRKQSLDEQPKLLLSFTNMEDMEMNLSECL